MATIYSENEGHRVTCDVPACTAARARRGQQNGRWLFNLRFGVGTITVTVQCAECGGTHTVTVPVPPEVCRN